MELNVHNCPLLKLAAMPKVETVIVPSHDFRGGVGEATICVVTPSVPNAVHAATGKPVRSPPLRHVKLVQCVADGARPRPRALRTGVCVRLPSGRAVTSGWAATARSSGRRSG